jgi:hypothetical protein
MNDVRICNKISVSNRADDFNNVTYDRTDDDRICEFPNTTEDNEEDRDDFIEINVNIFRYKFTEEFMEELYQFSKIHQYDERKVFKESWTVWTEENDEIISKEVRRLTELGYEGDILDKMFKSARYYFRKKSTEKKEPCKRREYVGVNRLLLGKMDEHIYSNIAHDDYKPSDGFDHFCKENVDLLKEEITKLYKSGLKESIEIKNKIKKTYKNRYFIIIKK